MLQSEADAAESWNETLHQPRSGTTGINAPNLGIRVGLEGIGIWHGAACGQTSLNRSSRQLVQLPLMKFP